MRMNKLIHSGLTTPSVSLSVKHLWVMPPQNLTAGLQAGVLAIHDEKPVTQISAMNSWHCSADYFV